jgi:hypothetical protein
MPDSAVRAFETAFKLDSTVWGGAAIWCSVRGGWPVTDAARQRSDAFSLENPLAVRRIIVA